MEEQKEKKRILIINTIGMGLEGISFVILNYLQHMSLEGLELHTIAHPKSNADMRKKMEALCTVHILPRRRSDLKGYLRGLREIFRRGIDVLHVHGNSGTMAIEVVLAKLCGVKKILVHAHSTRTDHPAVNAVLKHPMMWLSRECIACSEASGQWLYGKYPYTLLNNAIELDCFRFQDALREQYRSEFGIQEGEFLIGHIGHFTEPKNHFFLIDVFAAFRALEPASKLLLISDGPRFRQVQEKVADMGLQDAVIFAGRRSDVAGIYSAMDLFILPSCWEGLPLVMVEAQANGLPVLVSDVVTREAKCLDRVWYKSLGDGAESWAESLRQLRNQGFDRRDDVRAAIGAKGFDIVAEAEILRNIYLKSD